jgi:hypothetical protein
LSTLKSQLGQTRPNDNLIVWDSKQVFSLQHLYPNQEAKVEFEVKLKDNWVPPDSEKNNVIIKNEVKVSDIIQEFSTKVSAKLGLSQKAYHANQQGIENSGPIPPEATKATTYAIVWQVKNDFNDVKNIKVKAVLPQNVTLSDDIIPEDQASHFSLDSQSREIVWLVGDILAGTGVVNSQPSLSFQVSLTPSFLQRGNVAGVIGQATITGEDQFTGKIISSISPAVNTDLPDDKNNSGGGVVQ